MALGSRSNPWIPNYGRARKKRPDLRAAPAPPPAHSSHTGSNAPPPPASSSSTASSSSATTAPKRRRRQQPQTAPTTGLTSLASDYLLGHLNELLTPGKSLSERIGSTLGEVGDDLNEMDRRLAKATENPGPLPDPLGKRTLGNIRFDQLVKAAEKGTLRTNQAGKLTTPPVRKAARQLKATRQHAAQSRRFRGHVPGLDPHQDRVITTVLREGDRMGASHKEKLAAIETALVESNARNLGYGDRDSEGWRQERTSIYGTGPQGPRNVRASARRFFEESISDTGGTRGAGMSAGQLAQTIQASAHPERYDQRKAEAVAILGAYERGRKPDPVAAERLRQAKAQARSLGIPTKARPSASQPQQPRKTPTIVEVGNIAQNRFGLRVGEHPAFGGVEPVHTDGSHHYEAEAIDVNGPPEKLAAFNEFVATRFGDQVAEMFYDPGINLKNGQPTSAIGGHQHVHVAIDEPGTEAHGLVVGSYPGLPQGQPVGYYGSGTSPQAARESAQRAKESVFMGIASLAAPTAAQAPLPQAFQQFQQGAEGESESAGELDIIERLLRKRRL